jgi:DNA mismatch repair ATPase MutS
MNHVEEQILNKVAVLFPDPFTMLAEFYQANEGFLDEGIVRFDWQIQFYVSYLDYIAKLRAAGLSFCYPAVSSTDKETICEGCFDIALASKLVLEGAVPIVNDVCLNGIERLIVVSGPNQGGKTTFARMLGQLHYLASLGCPVPGTRAVLFLPDAVHTHFELEERSSNHIGKLEDDIVRIHGILGQATPQSLIVINEIFASTSFRDALFLSKKIAEAIFELDALCVWVTFIEEIASLRDKTVSYVSTVDAKIPTVRTFKIVRKPADGLAYAMSVAEQHQLTYEAVKERVRR